MPTYRAYLLDDALLEEALETKQYNGESRSEVYLDGFVCRKVERSMQVKGTDGGYHKVAAISDFIAHARRVGVPLTSNLRLRCDDELGALFNGSLHLAWFVDDELKWVVRNIIVSDAQYYLSPELLTLSNPQFQAVGFTDLRKTARVGDEKSVAGSTDWPQEGSSISMGCQVTEPTCSICGRDDGQYKHVGLDMTQKFLNKLTQQPADPRIKNVGDHVGELLYEQHHGPRDNTVKTPADSTAMCEEDCDKERAFECPDLDSARCVKPHERNVMASGPLTRELFQQVHDELNALPDYSKEKVLREWASNLRGLGEVNCKNDLPEIPDTIECWADGKLIGRLTNLTLKQKDGKTFFVGELVRPLDEMKQIVEATACEFGEHDKCYSNMMLTSDPPQYPWICRRCGQEGSDRGTSSSDGSEFNRIKERFANLRGEAETRHDDT